MNKLKFLLLFLGISLTTIVFGQEESDIFTRHEVSVGYGVLPCTSIANIHSGNRNFPATNEFIGSVLANYTYKFNKVIGLGVTFAYDNNNYDMVDKNADRISVCNVKQNIFSALVHLKVNWVRTKVVTMYSKVGFGGSYYNNKVTKLQPEELYDINTDNMKKGRFAYSIVPVGIELGNKQYAAFMQCGYGVEGIFSIGFRLGLNKTYKQ